MRYNGIFLLLSRAARESEIPEAQKYLPALTLGAVRDDILYFPWVKKIWEHLSLSHFMGRHLPGGFIPFFWPSAPFKAQYFYNKAIKLYRAEDPAAAWVQLGRASHLIVDMACPVHASRVPHWSDPYEWYVDSHFDELKQLPAVDFEKCQSARELTKKMGKYSQGFRPDKTNQHWGQLLKKMGLRKSLTRGECQNQAHAIIPQASACLAELFRLFSKEVSALK
jgi:hypothetical protein